MFFEPQTILGATKFFELIVVLFYLIVEKKNLFHFSENFLILFSHVNQGRKYHMVLFILTLN